jgi:hypothetical protein
MHKLYVFWAYACTMHVLLSIENEVPNVKILLLIVQKIPKGY